MLSFSALTKNIGIVRLIINYEDQYNIILNINEQNNNSNYPFHAAILNKWH